MNLSDARQSSALELLGKILVAYGEESFVRCAVRKSLARIRPEPSPADETVNRAD